MCFIIIVHRNLIGFIENFPKMKSMIRDTELFESVELNALDMCWICGPCLLGADAVLFRSLKYLTDL